MRVNTVVTELASETTETKYVVGPEIFMKEQRDPLTPETLSHLAPGSVAKVFVDDYLGTPAR